MRRAGPLSVTALVVKSTLDSEDGSWLSMPAISTVFLRRKTNFISLPNGPPSAPRLTNVPCLLLFTEALEAHVLICFDLGVLFFVEALVEVLTAFSCILRHGLQNSDPLCPKVSPMTCCQ